MSYIEWIRGRVGRRKIFLVFGTVVLRDEEGGVLLQRRTDFDFWGLPGGALEIDEDIESCARRELAEETGLAAGEMRLVGVYTDPRYDVVYPNGDQAQQFTVCFEGTVGGGRMRPDGRETTYQKFFAPAEIPYDQMPIWYRDMVQDTLAGGPPRFLPPYGSGRLEDQIASVRPFIGQERYTGVGAMVVVVRDDGRILLIQRNDHERHWAFPAGFCDLGENVAHTAVRETLEETGLQVELERIVGVYSAPAFHYTYAGGDQIKNVGVIFRARPMGSRLRMDPAEIRQIAWLTVDEVAGRVASSRFHVLFEQVLNHLDEGYFVC
ncbi:MAG TPA: NUDIX domain-containing protein [Anaerolineae bacterium]